MCHDLHSITFLRDPAAETVHAACVCGWVQTEPGDPVGPSVAHMRAHLRGTAA